MAIKSYGESTYKAFLILKDEKGNKSKHYISGVDKEYGENSKSHVNISFRMGSNKGDECMSYKLGSSKHADIAVKTWIAERDKKHKYYSSNLPEACYDYLDYKKNRRK